MHGAHARPRGAPQRRGQNPAQKPPARRHRPPSPAALPPRAAGYFSTTNRIKDLPTPLEAALGAVTSAEALATLEKILYNVAVAPAEAKFRRLKLGNARVKATVEAAGVREALALVGWEACLDAADGPLLVLPKRGVDMATVRAVQAAAKELARRDEDAAKKRRAAEARPGDAHARALRRQLEEDRRERANKSPVRKASKAQALPTGKGAGGMETIGGGDGGDSDGGEGE